MEYLNEIKDSKSNIRGWVTDAFIKAEKAIERKMFYSYFLTTKEQRELGRQRRKNNTDNRKWAWIMVGKTKMLCFVDNVTMKAYKVDGYAVTWMQWKKFTFIRWATTFDL